METPTLIISILELARTGKWAAAKEQQAFTIVHRNQLVEISLVARPKLGNLIFFFAVCPACGRLARDLFDREGELGCRRCLGVLHPDQMLSGSRWNRRVVRPARQIARIDTRLQRQGLDRNLRRRLRRRRTRLLKQVEEELAQRHIELQVELTKATSVH